MKEVFEKFFSETDHTGSSYLLSENDANASAIATLEAYEAPAAAALAAADAGDEPPVPEKIDATLGCNECKILTETLWNQAGSVVIPIDGIQKTMGVAYNAYCPNLEGGTSKCVTGCTNTADAQVIYYWIDKGYSFTFNVTNDDYYYVCEGGDYEKGKRIKVTMEQAGEYGGATVEELNELLSDYFKVDEDTGRMKYQSGEFVAALNYYCGVKNHANYGDSTGTPIGNSNTLYGILGFDCHRIIYGSNKKYYSKTQGFNPETKETVEVPYLNDLGYAIVRECLDYGEALRVEVMGQTHSIYLDGYSWDSSTNDYSYHFNYGWGTSSATRWYTTAELKEYKYHITDIFFDTTPAVSVHVSNSRSDYWAGSMERGLERINLTQNDTSTDVTFAENLAGETITATSSWSVSKNVDVNFVNFNANFVTDQQQYLIQSSNAITFDTLSAMLVVNKKSAYVVRETGNEALTVNISGGGIFAGKSEDSLETILDAMEDFSENGYSVVSGYETAANGYALYSKDADDSVTLTDKSIVMGDIDLGKGNNTISIEGSCWFGKLLSTAVMTFDLSEAYTDVLYKLNGALTALTDNASMIIDITGMNRSNDTYALIDCSNDSESAAAMDDITFTLRDGESTTTVKVGDPTEHARLVRDGNVLYVSLSNDVTPPEISLTLTPQTLVKSATLTAETDDGSAIYYNTVSEDYKGDWTLYKDAITVMENGSYYFKATDSSLNTGYNSITVVNVDSEAPVITVSPSTRKFVYDSVTLYGICTDNVEVASFQYKIGESEEWLDYTEPLVLTENTKVLFRGEDTVGNETTYEYTVSNIDRVAPELSVSANTDKLVSSVKLTADFSDDCAMYDVQYQINGGEWKRYYVPVTVTENGIVKFVAQDSAGNKTAVDYTVTNIYHPRNDVDGNGFADVIMTIDDASHPADGATGAWLIQADQTPVWGDLSTRGSDWTIFGTGFTTAGKTSSDIYVKSADNVLGAWVTDKTGKVTGWKTIETFNDQTTVLGLGDFNGNGQSDVLLCGEGGSVGCFFTGGEKPGWNEFGSLGDEWQICGIGDLNGDGLDDLVVKNASGTVGSWLVQEDGSAKWADLDNLQDGFEIAGCGDFNGDGTDDVLLQKDFYFGCWILKDGSINSWMGLGEIGEAAVEQIADFNGDGVDDLRLRTAYGDLGAQLVMGEDNLQWKYYGSVGSEWNTSLASL